MTDILTLIHTADAPAKPSKGAACNGCGMCCAAEACGVAVQFMGITPETAPCPAMEHDDGKFVCGLMRRPSHYIARCHPWADAMVGKLIADALGAGKGCDSDGPLVTASAFLAMGDAA